MKKVFYNIIKSFRFFQGFIILILFLSVQISHAQNELKIKKIKILGNNSISTEELLKQLNTKSPALFEKLISGEKNERFSNFTFDEDIIRLKKYYQQNGFLNPSISTELIPNRKNNKISIRIKIDEGEVISIDKIEYSILSDSLLTYTLDSLKKIIPIKKLSRFRDADIFATERILKDGFASKGFPYVEVINAVELRAQENNANLFFEINPGQKSYFGEIELLGDSMISRTLIDKKISIKKGDMFSISEMEKTRVELLGLGLFSYTTIRANLDDVSNHFIPVTIQLKELPRWSLKTGVGYGTEDKVRISLLLTRLNFLGGARTLIFKAQHSYFNPINFDLKFIQPDLFGKEIELAVNPYFSKEREESYEVRRVGSAFTFQKEISKNTNAYLSYSLGNDYVTLKNELFLNELNSIEPGNNKSGLTLGIERSTANDLFYPTSGVKLKFTGTYMGLGFNSKYHYYKFLLDAAWYEEIATNVVIAGKLKGGIIEATQNDLSTPIEDRFLMGGATSLRGWGRHQISPIDENGNKLGGNTMLEGSIELRFPVYEIISATAFMDVGNVWKDSWESKISDLLYNAGVGLRIKTPVGPIRIDVATPVFEKKFNPQFFITIGHAF